MKTTLVEIVSHKRQEVEERKKQAANLPLGSNLPVGDGRFRNALTTPGQHFIAEIKPKSPSAGILREDIDLQSIVFNYNKHVDAISVLTDKKFFGGSFHLLSQVREMSSLPILCKDFILDPWQCMQARRAGADAVLLMVKILDDGQLLKLLSCVRELGMTPVVEVQNEVELERIKKLNAEVVLINNRNLDTFEIDLSTVLRLSPLIPIGSVVVAASGIETRQDIEYLIPACSNFLIGSSLMRARDICKKLKELEGDVSIELAETFQDSCMGDVD